MAGKNLKGLFASAVVALGGMAGMGQAQAANNNQTNNIDTPNASYYTLDDVECKTVNSKRIGNESLSEYKDRTAKERQELAECKEKELNAHLAEKHEQSAELKAMGDVGREMYQEEHERKVEANKNKTIAGHDIVTMSPEEAKDELIKERATQYTELNFNEQDINLEH